jgi:replicative DNA helicase
MIIVDYLQLMRTSHKAENRQQEISEISRSLKGLARELNVPVIALSQLSRAVEQRQKQIPQVYFVHSLHVLTRQDQAPQLNLAFLSLAHSHAHVVFDIYRHVLCVWCVKVHH